MAVDAAREGINLTTKNQVKRLTCLVQKYGQVNNKYS